MLITCLDSSPTSVPDLLCAHLRPRSASAFATSAASWKRAHVLLLKRPSPKWPQLTFFSSVLRRSALLDSVSPSLPIPCGNRARVV